jgi:hypothetical protein
LDSCAFVPPLSPSLLFLCLLCDCFPLELSRHSLAHSIINNLISSHSRSRTLSFLVTGSPQGPEYAFVVVVGPPISSWSPPPPLLSSMTASGGLKVFTSSFLFGGQLDQVSAHQLSFHHRRTLKFSKAPYLMCQQHRFISGRLPVAQVQSQDRRRMAFHLIML